MLSAPLPTAVLCIGHAAYDLTVFVQRFPKENSKSETDELLECGGGPAANAAYLLSSWGIKCAFGGLIGDDAYGHRILSEFASQGTDVSLVEIRPGHLTPFSTILVNRFNGSRTLINRKASAGTLRLRARAMATMSPRVLLFDGHELGASLQALHRFPGALSILDAGSLREGTRRLADKVSYLVASENFALQFFGLHALDSHRARRNTIAGLRARYGNTVVITLGERGLIALNSEGYAELPAFQTKAVDTTGAGDVFHGAFAYGLVTGLSFGQTLALASMAASLSVQRKGGRTSIPTLAEVRLALRKTSPGTE